MPEHADDRAIPLIGALRDDVGMPLLTSPTIAPGSLSQSEHPSIPVGQGAVLRPWKLTDAPAVMQAFADPDIQRWHVRVVDTLEEAREWISVRQSGWTEESQLNWALADIESDELLGRVSIKVLDHGDGLAGAAYWMLPSARGRGLCTSAVTVVCRWAFEVAGFHRIELDHSTDNEASCRVAVKSGFREEGIRRAAALHADGWHDMHVHALLASDERP